MTYSKTCHKKKCSTDEIHIKVTNSYLEALNVISTGGQVLHNLSVQDSKI